MQSNVTKTTVILSWIRFIYLAVYVAVVSTTYSIWMSTLNLPFIGRLYTILGIIGAIILVVDFFYRQVLFTPRYSGLLVLFVISVIVSSIVNIRYGYVDNIKTLIWTCIQIFLMASVDATLPSALHKKQLCIFMDVFSAVWFVWVIFSLIQYLNQSCEIIYLPEFDNNKVFGFLGGRLFGVFKDPNYAALCSVAAVVFAIVSIVISGRSIIRIIVSAVQIIVQCCYIILSGSRTMQVALLASAILVAALFCWRIAERYTRNVGLKVCASVVGAFLIAILMTIGFNTAKTGLSYLPGIYASIRSDVVEPETTEACEVTEATEQIVESINTENRPEQNNAGQQNNAQVSLTRPDVAEGDGDYSNNRFEIWSNYFEICKSVPLFGTSPRNSLSYVKEYFPDSYIAATHYSVHNSYLALFVYTGLVGAVLMLIWLIIVVFEVLGYIIRRRNCHTENYYIVLVLTVFLLSSAIAAIPLQYIFFSNSVYDILFWVVLGYVRGFVYMDDPERYSKKPVAYRIMQRIRKQKKNGLGQEFLMQHGEIMTKPIRNYGIDFLRIVLMLGVVALHVLGHGGVLAAANDVVDVGITWFIEVLAYPSVNAFVLISGFVGYSAEKYYPKLRRIVNLWCTAFFYSVLITLVAYVYCPESVGIKNLIKSLLPLLTNQYWFFTAYFAMILISPVIHLIVDKADMRMLIIECICFCFFGIVETVTGAFALEQGYSFIWFIYLYSIGAAAKKYNIFAKIPIKVSLYGIVLLMLITWLPKVCYLCLPIDIFGAEKLSSMLISYCSPTILLLAFLWVSIFEKMRINTNVARVISWCSPSVFSVYLIHDHYFARKLMMIDRFTGLVERNVFIMFAMICLSVIGIFSICILVDKLRGLLFKLLHVETIAFKMEIMAKKVINKVLTFNHNE